ISESFYFYIRIDLGYGICNLIHKIQQTSRMASVFLIKRPAVLSFAITGAIILFDRIYAGLRMSLYPLKHFSSSYFQDIRISQAKLAIFSYPFAIYQSIIFRMRFKIFLWWNQFVKIMCKRIDDITS